jgi:acylphosphatase
MEGIKMANENLKKFLDSAGVGHLWGKVTEKIAADVKVEADRAKAEELKLQNKFGDLGDSTVKAYVDAKTENIASNDTVAAIQKDVNTIKGDYVKAADIADFETKENVQKVADDLAGYKSSNDAALAGVKATADAAAVKTEVEAALALKADKSDLNETDEALAALKARVEAFLDNTGAATEAIDTLQELINYIQTHDDVEMADLVADIQAINNKLAGIDGTVKAYVDGAIEALNIGDYAKAADLTALAGRVSTLEGKVDVAKVSEAIATAANGAEANAKAYAKDYADGLNTAMDGRVAALEGIDHDAYKAADTALQGVLEGKIATAKGEAIAEAERLNGLMDTRVQAVEAAKHTHANKTVLDGIDATDIEKWDAAQANAEATAKAYTDEQFALIRALSTDEIDAAIAG